MMILTSKHRTVQVAHDPEYQGTWGPPQASVWDDIGAAP